MEQGKRNPHLRERQIRLAADLSTESWQAGRERHDIVKVLKGKNMLRIQQEYHSE